jgi:hypothetical protein
MDEIKQLKMALDSIAIHTLHMLWILDSEKYPELKEYFDSFPRGLLQHVDEINTICAGMGSEIAMTGKIENEQSKNKPGSHNTRQKFKSKMLELTIFG